MGLTLREARRRLDAVLEFAELEEFVDLKLKNYSSGMLVRLAFAVMVQADADIMLIDEVLAVGDAAFGQKCLDVFHERRRAGRTVLLVTHDMAMVQSLCHRGMVIQDGELTFIGEPEDVAQHYLRLNFGGKAPHHDNVELDLNARVIQAELLDAAGTPVENVERGVPLHLDVVVEAARDLGRAKFIFHVLNEDGVVIIGFSRSIDEPIDAGQRVRLSGRIENRLAGGRYVLNLYVREDRENGAQAVQGLRLARFLVYGTETDDGLVSVQADIEPVLERDVGAAS
jgi:ABC-2 type transport system ATP-binding protein